MANTLNVIMFLIITSLIEELFGTNKSFKFLESNKINFLFSHLCVKLKLEARSYEVTKLYPSCGINLTSSLCLVCSVVGHRGRVLRSGGETGETGEIGETGGTGEKFFFS